MEKLQWMDYSVGERDAHYRVYTGPVTAEQTARRLRDLGLRANAGTSHVYIVITNLPDCAQAILAHLGEGFSARDLYVLK